MSCNSLQIGPNPCKPRIVHQTYLGTVDSIHDAFTNSKEPMAVEEVEFGLTAVMWGLAQRVGIRFGGGQLLPEKKPGP